MARMRAKFLRTALELRRWLERHHEGARELVVGFHKRAAGRASLSWPESVDEALCCGWIDGVRRRLDPGSHTIRFTPRRPGSIWSRVNTRRARALFEQGRMQAAGLRAFKARKSKRSGRYSYEQRPAGLVGRYRAMLARNATARGFFASQTPSYRRAASWWVLSAKREETRLRRAATLIELSAVRKLIAQFLRKKP